MANETTERRGLHPAWINGGFAVLAALIGGFFTWYCQRPATEFEKAEKTVDELVAESPVSLTTWQTMATVAYRTKEDKQRNFRDHIGKQVTWRGVFDQCNPNRYNATPERSFCMILYDSQMTYDQVKATEASRNLSPLGKPFVRCWFPETAARELAQLTPRQRIVVRGTLANPTMTGTTLGTDLSHCQLVAAEDEYVAEAPANPKLLIQ